jgi:hypothetical protein
MMYSFKPLVCYNCKSVILTLSNKEIAKFKGLNFQCECCGHQNQLNEFQFNKSSNNDPLLNTFSVENLYTYR